MLYDFFLSENGSQNPADHCVYIKQTEGEAAILIIWVDDPIIAASYDQIVKDVKGC